eukprot:24616-Chlamydomonas_euryale.AAC.2
MKHLAESNNSKKAGAPASRPAGGPVPTSQAFGVYTQKRRSLLWAGHRLERLAVWGFQIQGACPGGSAFRCRLAGAGLQVQGACPGGSAAQVRPGLLEGARFGAGSIPTQQGPLASAEGCQTCVDSHTLCMLQPPATPRSPR